MSVRTPASLLWLKPKHLIPIKLASSILPVRILTLIGGCFLAGLIQATGAPVTIRMSTQWPLASTNGLSFLHFKDRLEAESKGDIHVEVYDNAKLYGDTAIAEAVSSGEVDMGFVSLSRYAAVI